MSKLIADTVETNAGAKANFREVGNTYDYLGVAPDAPNIQLDTFPTWCNRIEVKFDNLGSSSTNQVAWFTFGNESGVINPFGPNDNSVISTWQSPTGANGIRNRNIIVVYAESAVIYNTGTMFAERIYPGQDIWRCYGNGIYKVSTTDGVTGSWQTETYQVDLSTSAPTKFGITRQAATVPIYGKWTTYYHEY